MNVILILIFRLNNAFNKAMIIDFFFIVFSIDHKTLLNLYVVLFNLTFRPVIQMFWSMCGWVALECFLIRFFSDIIN